MDKISVIVSCYNEEKALPLFYEEIERICQEYYNTYGEEGMEIAAEVLNEMEEDTGTLEERLEIIKELYHRMNNIKVIAATGAAVDVAMLNECKAIIRGLRSLSDYDYEVQLQQINKDISNNKVNTVCLFADKEFQFVSSSMVKEVFKLDKDVSNYVDSVVQKQMIKKRDELYGRS